MEEYNTNKTLLLAYTYFLNKEHTLAVSTGFDSESCKTSILFQRIYNNQTSFYKYNYDEWKKLNKLSMKYLYDKTCSNAESAQKFFIFNEEEEGNLHNISDFINSVITYNKSAEDFVKAYVTKYINTCMEKQQLKLQNEIYMPHGYYNVQCNYSRLFFEIPIMLKEKISKLLQTNIK